MFYHKHPYGPYIPQNTQKLIVGTLPPPRFTTGELLPGDIDFCYGSKHGQLWRILDRMFGLGLEYVNSGRAIKQRKDFLHAHALGVCDIVDSAYREKIDATDLGMQKVQLRDMFYYLDKHPGVHTLLFMGGNSKNGPEYFFRKIIKDRSLNLVTVSSEVPRIYSFVFQNRKIHTVSLTAPSGSANRAIGSMSTYKALKDKDSAFTTFDFRVMQYRRFFEEENPISQP